MVIELQGKRGAQSIVQAIESYKARLGASIERSRNYIRRRAILDSAQVIYAEYYANLNS